MTQQWEDLRAVTESAMSCDLLLNKYLYIQIFRFQSALLQTWFMCSFKPLSYNFIALCDL